MDFKQVEGNLLEAAEQYICHQCNMLTDHAAGTAKLIFDRFPYADIYKDRDCPHIPTMEEQLGNILIRGDGKDQRFVINMMAQFYPGKPKYPNSSKDGTLVRLNAFKQCLDKIALLPDLQSVAFPYKIGCNLAGGNWDTYYNMIEQFADKVQIPVRIYKNS